jgi:predicted ester cyclase
MATDLKALNRRFLEEVLNGGDLDRIDDMISEDVVEHIPVPGTAQGREGAHQAIAMMRDAFPDLRMETEVELQEGDLHAAVQRVTGTHEGDFMDIPPTGRHVSVLFVEVSRVRDGVYTEHWGLMDVEGIMSQLGVQPSAAQP